VFNIKQLIIGFTIGGGMILPGVSGGVLAVVFGIYEKLIDAVLNFFKDWKKHLVFLLPILIGVVIGVITFGRVLSFVFQDYPMEAGFTFIGLILGGIPVLFNKIKTRDTKKINMLMLGLAFALSLLLFVLGKNTFDINFSNYMGSEYTFSILLFITGIIYISGKIIPGISGSFLLMLVGMYEYTLDIVSRPFALTSSEQMQLIPIFLGVIVGALLLLRLMNKLINEYHNDTYSAIIGFVIGSIAAIYPGFNFDYRGLISVTLLILAFAMSYLFSLSEKVKR